MRDPNKVAPMNEQGRADVEWYRSLAKARGIDLEIHTEVHMLSGRRHFFAEAWWSVGGELCEAAESLGVFCDGDGPLIADILAAFDRLCCIATRSGADSPTIPQPCKIV